MAWRDPRLCEDSVHELATSEATHSVCSLPPCGGGLGRGVATHAALSRQRTTTHIRKRSASGDDARRDAAVALYQSTPHRGTRIPATGPDGKLDRRLCLP